jgi:hypothetical protein
VSHGILTPLNSPHAARIAVAIVAVTSNSQLLLVSIVRNRCGRRGRRHLLVYYLSVNSALGHLPLHIPHIQIVPGPWVGVTGIG